MMTIFFTGGRKIPGILLGGLLILILGCATAKEEIDPLIRADLEEALKGAPTDELSKSYDPLSLLQKAETLYQEGNFVEAVAEYEYFLNLHPLHRWASYAQYKLGLSYFHQIQTVDRDIEPALKALSAFQKLLDIYAGSPYREAALEKILYCKERLAQREFYIGHFYYNKTAYSAAIARFEELLEKFPETESAEKTMFYLALSYQGLGEIEKAKEGLRKLLDKYPKTEFYQKGSRLLSRLDGQKT